MHIAVSKNSLSLQSQNVDSFTLCTYTALLIWPLNYYGENAQDLKIDFCSFICVIKLFLFMETNFLSKRNVSALLDYHWFRLQWFELELKPWEGKVSASSISCSFFVLALSTFNQFMVSLQEYFKAVNTSSFGGLKLNHIICNSVLLYTCKWQYFTILWNRVNEDGGHC